MNIIKKTCLTCVKEFFKPPSYSKNQFEDRKYCSSKCRPAWNKGKKGFKHSGSFKSGHSQSNTGKTHFKKGQKAWNEDVHIYLGGGFKKGHPKPKNAFKWGMREKHPNWIGGRINHAGYILVLNPKHPFCNNNGYVFEHRLVMEKHIGRHLNPKERIHHINKNKKDNRIKNLALCANESEHQKIYHPSKTK